MAYNNPYNNNPYNPVIGYVNTTPQVTIITDPITGQKYRHERRVHVATPQPQPRLQFGYHQNNQNNHNGYHNGYQNGYQNGYHNGNHNGNQNGNHNGNHNGYNNQPRAVPILSVPDLMNQVYGLHNGYPHPF